MGQERNVHGMKLVAGDGNEYVGGRATEGDTFNTVYVVVSTCRHSATLLGR